MANMLTPPGGVNLLTNQCIPFYINVFTRSETVALHNGEKPKNSDLIHNELIYYKTTISL